MTWITAQAPFRIPQGLTPDKQVDFCVSIINRYRAELPILREGTTKLKDKTKRLEEEVEYWKRKYQEGKEKREKVEKELEKVLKTKNRYQVALFDHGNFKYPGKSKKTKGGQAGRFDTNREAHIDYSTYLTEIMNEITNDPAN